MQQLDADQEKAMMAWHFKRQEQEKVLFADGGGYTTAAWMNAKSLKQDLSGVQNIELL